MNRVRQLRLGLLAVVLAAAAASAARAGVTVEFRPQASGDDTFAMSSESLYSNATSYWPYRNNDRLPFARFSCQIPAGAVITEARLKLCSNGGKGDASPATVRLQVVDRDDCPLLSTPNPFTYAVTPLYVDWVLPGAWTADAWYASPDLSALVQDFIDRPGYQFGHHIGIRGSNVSGSYKVAYQWDYGDHSSAPILEVTYTGGEAKVDLLMADPEVRIGQKIYCRTFNVNDDDTLEAVLDGAVIFSRSGSQVQAEEMFTADYSNLTAGEHTLAVRVVAPDRTVRGQSVRTWTTLHNGVPHVGINVNNALCIDGEPYLPITSWMFDKDRFSDPLSTTINTLLSVGWYPEVNLPNWQDYLGRGQAQGWYAAGPGSWAGKASGHVIDSDLDSLAAYVAATKDHPALLTWFWDDEPDLYADNAAGTRLLHETTHQYDTNHPTWVNLVGYNFTHGDQGWSNNRAKEYCYLYNEPLLGERTLMADIVGLDYYPHEYSTHYDFCNLSDYLLAIDRLRAWNYDLVPTASFIQPCDEAAPGNPRLGSRTWSPPPTGPQVKNLVWLTLIHEVKVLSWFHHFEWVTNDPRPNLSAMQETVAWITDLTPVILSAGEDVTTGVSVTPADGYRVDIMTRLDDQENLYVFSGEVRDWGDPVYIWPDPEDTSTAYFNIPQGSFTARFDVEGLPAGTAIAVYGEDRAITSEAGYFEDTFDVHDVHIYVVPAGGAPLGGDANLDGQVDLDDFVILKQNFGAANASWNQGDFNGDGDVDLDDFVILKQTFGN
ncbi:MAG: hypothetical protein GX591_15780 [Planctomycetes bacterium]|nr:hypothetical protein [Planctomycetota bacterium]